MAELSGIYGADPFANMTPKEFLQMAQGQGLGKVPVSTEFPGLGSDFGGIDRYLERKAEDSYKGIDPSVLANQAEAGNALAAAELANREGEFGGLGLPLDSAMDQALELPEIDMSGLDVEYQMEKAAKKKAQGEAAEAFRANEAKLAGSQGGLNSMGISESQAVTQEQADEGFLAAMDDFFEAARGAGPDAPKKRTIEEYKKAFSEATGIDTSGKVDKKDALMAFGLALMQNKAGKGFNVGKMLQSVGEAGDKAMPALQRAKALAREGALAGGTYALQTQAADEATRAANQEKMMNRSQYWVYERGEPGAEFTGFDKGQLVPLNKYELNKLIMDPKFEKRYEFISAADRMDVLAKRAEGQDLGEQWGSKFEPVSLIGGKWEDQPAALVVSGVAANPNYGGTTATKYKLGEDAGEVVNRFIGYQEGINKDQATFKTLIKNIEAGVSIPGQAIDKVTGFFRAIGYTPPGGMPSNTAQAKQALANFSIDNATDILKESGKTLSDGDRKLVSERVGKIDFFNNDPVLILNQVIDIYDFTVTKAQKNLDTAIGSLEKNFGISISSGKNSDMPTQAELDAMNQANGTNLTMADFK
jgi:hypothetical protein